MHKEDFSALSLEVMKIGSNVPNDMKAVMLRSRSGNSNYVVNNNSKNIYKTVKPSS